MNDAPWYDWDDPADHLWLAADESEDVAVFTCAVAHALPTWVQVPANLLVRLEERILEELPSITAMDRAADAALSSRTQSLRPDYVAFVRHVAFRGLYYFDYPVEVRGPSFFTCLAAPQQGIKTTTLPNSFATVTRYFRVANRLFRSGTVAPTDFRCPAAG